MNARREEWFQTFENIFENDFLYIINIGYFDYRVRKSKEGKSRQVLRGRTLHFNVGGKGTLEVGDKKYEIGPGDVFSMPPNVSIAFYPDEEDSWRYYWFKFDGSYSDEICKRMGLYDSSPVVHCDFMPKIQEKIEELLHSEFNYGDFYYRAMSALFYILSFFAKEEASPTASPTSLIGRAKEIIFSSYMKEDFSVSSLPELLHVSPTYLRRVFQKEIGQTPVNFLIVTRLNAAANYLRKEKYSIKDLCYLVGYREEAHFVRAFRNRFGVSPKEYRKRILEKTL